MVISIRRNKHFLSKIFFIFIILSFAYCINFKLDITASKMSHIDFKKKSFHVAQSSFYESGNFY